MIRLREAEPTLASAIEQFAALHLESTAEERRKADRSDAVQALYGSVDALVAAKVDVGAFGGWRAALLGDHARRLASELDAAIATVRAAIDKLGGV